MALGLLARSMTTAVQGSAMTGAGPMLFSVDQSLQSGGQFQSPNRMSGEEKRIRDVALRGMSTTYRCTQVWDIGFSRFEESLVVRCLFDAAVLYKTTSLG